MAHSCHICTGTGLAHSCHICTGTGLAHYCHIYTGTGPLLHIYTFPAHLLRYPLACKHVMRVIHCVPDAGGAYMVRPSASPVVQPSPPL